MGRDRFPVLRHGGPWWLWKPFLGPFSYVNDGLVFGRYRAGLGRGSNGFSTMRKAPTRQWSGPFSWVLCRRGWLLGQAALSLLASRIRAMVELARTESGIPVAVSKLDSDPWILNALNGTIDLRTGDLSPHDPEQLITKLLPADYDPVAYSPIWAQFLDSVFKSDSEVKRFVQRAVGYSLTASTREQVMFVAYGDGSNGKSTFLETVRELLADYGQQAPTEMLLDRRDAGIPNDIARLRGVRFVSAVETSEGKRLAEATVKQLTGGDTISARFMRGEWFDFRPTAKIWMATNHRPTIRGIDHGIWRRLLVIPFEQQFDDASRDNDLMLKLRNELPGILTWAVEGCLEWQRDGLGVPETIRDAMTDYRNDQDTVGRFLDECCEVNPNGWVPAADLYEAYRRWSVSQGESLLAQRQFGMRLSHRGLVREKLGPQRRWAWRSLALVDFNQPPL